MAEGEMSCGEATLCYVRFKCKSIFDRHVYLKLYSGLRTSFLSVLTRWRTTVLYYVGTFWNLCRIHFSAGTATESEELPHAHSASPGLVDNMSTQRVQRLNTSMISV